MTEKRYGWVLLVLICTVMGTLVVKHLHTKNFAEEQINTYIAKQGVPSKDIYDEKFVWDWQKSGDYVKNFKVRGDSADITYQYLFIGKGQEVLFTPYSPTSDEPDVKYPPNEEEPNFILYRGEAYDDGDFSLYVYNLKSSIGADFGLPGGKYVLHKSGDIFDADGNKIEADDIKKGDKLKVYLSESTAIKETYPGQIDAEYIFKVVRE
ncbi:DUF3139 domain-containing protein [Listeria weihenstephanensis]|uniref:DUF3139 domain-containing protein n=1 Tax=Listeria weihenstephanensis TaxID=1006155 RepID=A0A841Z5W8_9LIST|nr:DUF3139 domain-containing protein [Listeria weihenstephanensis]MBC1499716.1 DUF3139 domain-containing protein [Listeria weihenstephanensis]